MIQNYLKVLSEIFKILKQNRFKDINGRTINYLEYCKLNDYKRGDEDTVVTPILIEILDLLFYQSGINLIQQDEQGGDIPDFRTNESNLFILDAKSTGVDIVSWKISSTFESPYQQISRYLKGFKGYRHGILFNLIKFEFFERYYENDLITVKRLEHRTLNLFNLFILHEQNDLDKLENSKDYENFRWFIDTFSYKKLKPEDYKEIIKNQNKQDLIVPDNKYLENIIYNLLEKIQNDIRDQISSIDEDSGEWHDIKFSLMRIENEIKIPQNTEKEKAILDEFVNQSSYVLLIKIILIRILEDNELIPKNLYNGGFKKLTEPPFEYTLDRVLKEAKFEANSFYPYFFNGSAYDFQIDNENLFIEILFQLSKINFAEINFDLIGNLYEHYLNEDERKEKGQYYTPHYIVEFILNRVGFTGRTGNEIDKRTVLDPACGSGGFLVEVAKRLREVGNTRENEAKNAIINNVYGVEITVFAMFLADVNIIIQILPLVKTLLNEKNKRIQPLKIIRQDSLDTIYNREELEDIQAHKLLIKELFTDKKDFLLSEIINKNDFDFVVGNPPYVGQKGHKELFRPLQVHEYWKHFYMGQSDYLYYFIILGLSKLKEGGKLGFITTQYWLTADGAKNLRKYILEKAIISEIIDFQGIKLFPEAQGQENIVFILEKCSDESQRLNNKIKIVHFKRDWVLSEQKYIDSKNQVTTNYERWKKLITNKEQFELFSNPNKIDFVYGKDKRNDIAEVYYSVILQGELDENAWNIYKQKKEDDLNQYENIKKLDDLFYINQGIVSGADRITTENLKKIKNENKEKYNIKKDDGIFILKNEEIKTLALNNDELKIVKPFYKNSDIKKGYIKLNDDEYVLYTQLIDDEKKYINIISQLEKYRDILDIRREVVQKKIRWFDLWWPRDKNIFLAEKIVTSRRSPKNCFAYENSCKFPQSDITLITKKENTKENLKYLLALLNSNFLDNWYKNNTKKKGNMREYYFTPLSKMPIRKINFNNKVEAEIHTVLGGDYKTEETDEKYFKYNKESNTYIRQKGLIDFYMELKYELYELIKNGFIFDPENEIDRKEKISFDIFSVSEHLRKENKNFSYLQDLSFFENVPGLKDDYSKINKMEKESLNKLIKNCDFYFRTKNKDFQIKKVIYEQDSSLFENNNKLKRDGFNYSVTLQTKDKNNIIIEIKDEKKSKILVEVLDKILKNKKEVGWEEIKYIPFFPNEQLKYIENKIEYIYNSLKPLDENDKKELKKLLKEMDFKKFEKIKNVNYIQFLIDLFVDKLYSM